MSFCKPLKDFLQAGQTQTIGWGNWMIKWAFINGRWAHLIRKENGRFWYINEGENIIYYEKGVAAEEKQDKEK